MEFSAQLLTFWVAFSLTKLIPGSDEWGPAGDIVTGLIAIVVGATLPALIFAAPTLTVQWMVDENERVSGVHQVDLRKRNHQEFFFRVQLFGHFDSLAGWLILRNFKKRQAFVRVEFTPTDSARIKRQSVTGGASLVSNEIIALPTTTLAQDDQHSMFYGSIKTVSAGPTLDVTTSASLGSNHRWLTRTFFVNVHSDVSGIKVLE
ncbi:hypothetical protein [Microbacterium sp. NPDC087591]|uniref:hypothetical protein n=1 Tax=Microbacterium sp. NPDC087591 TaxID=3364192 RepID=UPI0038082035